MTEDLLDYWLRIIKPLFPTNAWVTSSVSGGDHLIQIDWKLENDPHRLNKRSRKIEIIIKEEAIDDYLNKKMDERALSDIKMKQWISERYNNFSFDQDAHTFNSASPDRWRISKGVLS
jgi:deoxyadenosine/deoxycytidine kinase